MKAARSVRRLLVVAAFGVAAVGVVAAAPATPVSAVVCTMCSGGEFHPLDNPVRAYYTSGTVGLGMGTTTSVDLIGPSSIGTVLGPNILRSDVLSLVATVTVTRPMNTGWLKVYSGPEPVTAVTFFRAGQAVSNWALITPDVNGAVKLKTVTPDAVKGTVRLTVDIVGWYSTSGYDGVDLEKSTADDHGLRLRGTAPVRIATSGAATVSPAAPLTVHVRTATNLVTGKPVWGAGVDTIKAVMLNVTATKPTVDTVLAVQASDSTAPLTRSLSVSANDTVSTLVTARVGADGDVVVLAPAGASMVTVDLVGIFQDLPVSENTAGRVVPLTLPFRAFETRLPAFGAVPLGPKQAEDWSFAAFANSVQLGGLSVGAQQGLLGNIINTSLARQYPTVPVASSLAVYRPSDPLPPIASVSTREGATTANSALITYGTNAVARIANRAGYAHYLLDVYAVVLS